MNKLKILSIFLILSLGLMFSFVSAECTDSDGGQDYYVKGTTTDAATTKMDSCWNDGSNKLSERYCSGEAFSVITYECPNGCVDGACVQETKDDRKAFESCPPQSTIIILYFVLNCSSTSSIFPYS